MLFVIYIVPPKPTYRHIYICGNTRDEDHFTSVCPTEQMDDKTCPVCKLRYSRKDVMCDIIETNTDNKSLKRRDAVPQIEGYTPPPPPLPPPL
jgi:hypothetical protein